jgi:diguanylate cyclase (GGDEF)-like protein
MAEIDRLLEGPSAVGLLFCDLDGFKGVNDRHGHVVGDELLATVARALDECLVAGERVFRYGGDEFVVVVAAGAEAAVDERVRDLGRRVEVAVAATGGAYGVGISTGTAVADATTTDATTLLDAADRAMYLAKRGRRSLVS